LFFSIWIVFLVNVFPCNEVCAYCSKQNNDVVGDKEHVKKTTREQKPSVSELFGQKEIGQRYNWKEQEKVKRAKQHVCENKLFLQFQVFGECQKTKEEINVELTKATSLFT
jgi:hypothetical protein